MRRFYFAILGLFAVLPPEAQAGPREDVMAASSRCFALADDKTWLDCYLAAARPMQAMFNAVPAATARVAAPAPKRRTGWFSGILGSNEKQPPQDFGAPATATSPSPVDHLTVRLSKYSLSPGGFFTVTLDNGQVWQQASGDTVLAPLKAPPSTYIATIRHGIFTGYTLIFKGIPGLYHVHRL